MLSLFHSNPKITIIQNYLFTQNEMRDLLLWRIANLQWYDSIN